MKREVIDFYADNKTPMEKLINIGVNRKGLTEASITAAAEVLYDEIQGGLNVLPVRIAWEVFSRAKILKGYVEKKELDKTIELQNVHDDLKGSFDVLQREYMELEEVLKNVQEAFYAAEKELEIKNRNIARYMKELEWYRQPWWKTIFRRPSNG